MSYSQVVCAYITSVYLALLSCRSHVSLQCLLAFLPVSCFCSFAFKVEAIRVATASSPPPTIDDPPFPAFTTTSVEEAARMVCDTQNKQCDFDPIPTWLVKELRDALVPVMANASFTQGRFPDSHKHAIVRPRRKKPSLDPTYITS